MSIKKKKYSGPFGLFYIEMIIVLFFFMTASAVILKTFAAADGISKESDILEQMSLCGQTAAESYAASGNVSETLKAAFGAEIDCADTAVIPINEKCVYSENGEYDAVVRVYEEESIPVMEIRFRNKNAEQLYSIRFAGYSEVCCDE